MKKTIQLKDIDPMIFAGTQDKHIKLIEKNFDSKIVLRGNQLYLDGNKNELKFLESLVNDMIFTINQKGYIEKGDIHTLIESTPQSKDNINGKINNVILYTPKGSVEPKTEGQKKYYQAVLDNDIVFAVGPAGTGKTYQAVACAVSALKNNFVEKIVITRPVVEAGEHLGFLPGDLKDKVDPYLTPLYDALYQMVERDKLKVLLNRKIIEIAPLAYMRGRTLNNSFMILDEAQNSTKMQMKMFLTRLGVTSKAIITGDITQTDLGKGEISGLVDAANVLNTVEGIAFVKLDEKDIVRHQLVKDIIQAYKTKDNK